MIPDSPDIRTALKALVEAMRSGPPATTADGTAPADFDAEFLDRTAPLLEFLWSRYFRVRLLGVENIPLDGPALVVSNHSGGIPYDGALLIHGVRNAHPKHRVLRPLVANFAFRSSWMAGVVSRFGGVRASMENAMALLEKNELVAVFPEGLRGVGKLYRERYRLTHFGRGGFVRLARAAKVPIVPIAVVGAEEIHPVVGKLTRIAKPLGLPYIPITPTFPLFGLLGLLPVPTKWTIKVGAPIEVPPAAEREDTLEVAETVRRRIDRMIADLLIERRSIIFG